MQLLLCHYGGYCSKFNSSKLLNNHSQFTTVKLQTPFLAAKWWHCRFHARDTSPTRHVPRKNLCSDGDIGKLVPLESQQLLSCCSKSVLVLVEPLNMTTASCLMQHMLCITIMSNFCLEEKIYLVFHKEIISLLKDFL